MPNICNRTIGGLWAINQPANVWIWVNGLGWRKLDTTNTTNLLVVAARAKIDGALLDLTEEVRGTTTFLTQITPVPFTPSAVEVSLAVSECIYGWTAAYEQRGTFISVRIQLNRDTNVTAAELASAQTRWATGIRNKWNGRFGCCDDRGASTAAQCPEACALSFDVQWVTSNAHHVVAVHRGPGRSDMLNWFHDDTGNNAAHEFGHMLRNRDEYTDANCPNRSPVNTGTVMAMVTGPVVSRHVDFLCNALDSGTVSL